MKNIFTGKKIVFFLHFVAWAIILGLPIYFFQRWEVGKDFIWLYYISNIINGIIFYINYLILVPRYFFKSVKSKYFTWAFLLLVFFYFVSSGSNGLIFRSKIGRDHLNESINSPADNRKPPEEMIITPKGPVQLPEGMIKPPKGPDQQPNGEMNPHDNSGKHGPPAPGRFFGQPPFRFVHMFNYFFTSVFLLFLSLGLRVLERHSQIEKSQKELEKEKLNSELAFLKNQISPHFFFNTLNNIYSLISINAEDSQKAVLKLSKMMRYLLYESEHGNTLLSNEIDFMNNYVDLMKLRMSDKVSLNISFPAKYDNMNVPPLLFIPFIENAFKHGISYRGKSFIDIGMETEKNTISFRCANSIAPYRDENENNHSGIGLENVRKRLNLLFPGRHDLKINKTETAFEVKLLINFT